VLIKTCPELENKAGVRILGTLCGVQLLGNHPEAIGGQCRTVCGSLARLYRTLIFGATSKRLIGSKGASVLLKD